MRLNSLSFIRKKMFSLSPSARRLAVAILAGLAPWLFVSCSKTAQPADAPAALTVGMELAYPPFEMEDPQGRPAGVSVDMAGALGDYLHEPVTIENIPFSGLIPSLKTGKIDLVISSMTRTPEREQSIDFSNPYLNTGLCLLVGKDSPIQGIGDVDRPGVTVVVKQGTTGQAYALDHIHIARVLVLDKETACVLEVVQGKADAFIYDQMSTYANWMRNRDRTRAILRPFQAESWAIGIQKGNDALREKVNAFLDDYRAKGGFEQLGDRYLSEEKAEFKKLNVPFVF
jgi:polar amino acid transport system substrate-binding protein